MLVLISKTSCAKVYIAEVDSVIDHGVAEYLERCINLANSEDAALLIIINTPGGTADATDRILEKIEESRIPIITYVPAGKKAFSAGAFIVIASHYAAMANNSAIGAAHPVGAEDEVLLEKITRAYMARLKAFAEERNRNATAIEVMINESKAYDANEAYKAHIINGIFENEDSLLDYLDGKNITVKGKPFTLNTRGRIEIKETSREYFLRLITDPTVAYLLFILGLYGLIFELLIPGITIGGVLGITLLILALYAFGTLEVSAAAILLIMIGTAMLAAELFVPSHGLLTLGASVAIILGSLMLLKEPLMPSLPIEVILATVGTFAAFFIFAIYKGIRAQIGKPKVGKEELIGKEAKVIKTLQPEGKVLVEGEIWNAVLRNKDSKAEEGRKVRIVDIKKDGLILIVEEM